MEPTRDKVIFLIVGWVLGLLGNLLIDAYRRHREDQHTRAALRTELWELRYRMAVVAYAVRLKLGTLDRATLTWLRPILVNYNGVNPSEGLLKAVDGLLSKPDEELTLLAFHGKNQPGIAPSLVKYTTPLLDARLGSLRLSNMDLLGHLLEVSQNLAMYNHDVERSEFFFGLTYNKGLSDGNHERAVMSV